MKWFVAKLVYRIVCGQGNHSPQFDHQFRLFEALSFELAVEKANKLGQTLNHSFYNNSKEEVTWNFIAITEITELEDLTDGVELISIIEEPADDKIFMEKINFAANRLNLLISRCNLVPNLY